MEKRGARILRVLLNRYHQAVREPLLRCLPPEEVQDILQEDLKTSDINLFIPPLKEQIKSIHYSWLRTAIQKLPESIQGSVVNSLSQEQSKKLHRWFPQKASQTKKLPQKVEEYLLNLISPYIGQKEKLPLSLLPNTELSVLGTLSKDQLVELIDYLGIYDLALEVRRIIDKSRLQKLIPCLTPKKKQFLHMCLHHADRLAAAPIELKDWNGDCKVLNDLLHRRGIIRLGKSLCGQHPDFVWHIARTLDIGRGTNLLQYYATTPIPNITQALVQQVLNLMSFLHTNEVPKST